jgi:phosphate transport system substrate-binding protein
MMRVMIRSIPLWCAALLAAAACKGGGAPELPLTYDGSTAISKQVLPDAIPAFEEESKHRFGRVGTSGAGKGLRAALAGEVSVAGVTRSLTADELAHRPYYQIIGYDALGVFVNAANPVRGLTKAQLKDLLSGRTKSWKELGGADRPVVVCTEHLDSGRATVDAVKTIALDGAAYGTVRQLEDPADCLALVAQDPGAITAATVAYAIPGTRSLPLDGVEPVPENVRSGAYLLSRPMLLVTKDVPTGAVKDFFDFMVSPKGQSCVQRKFIGLR